MKPSTLLKQIALGLAVSTAAVALTSCDSKQENAREDKAEAVRETGEKKADAIESKKSLSNDHSTNATLEKKADATRNAADAQADKIEHNADALHQASPAPTP